MRPQIPAVLSTLPSPTWASPLIAQSSTALLPGHVTEPFATTRELVNPKHRGEQRSALSSAGGLALPASVGVSPSLRGNAILSVYFETTSHTPCRSLSLNSCSQGSAQATGGSSSSSGDSKVSGRVNTMSAPGIPAGARCQYPAFLQEHVTGTHHFRFVTDLFRTKKLPSLQCLSASPKTGWVFQASELFYIRPSVIRAVSYNVQQQAGNSFLSITCLTSALRNFLVENPRGQLWVALRLLS